MMTVIIRTETTAKIELSRDEINAILIAEIKRKYELSDQVCVQYAFDVDWDYDDATVVIRKETIEKKDTM